MDAMITWAEGMHAKAKDNIEKVYQKQKKEYDAKHQFPTFNVRDEVLMFNSWKETCQGGKLEWNLNGLLEIIEKTTRGMNILPTEHTWKGAQAVH